MNFLSFEDFIIDQENWDICDVTCDQLYNKIQREKCKIWRLNWMKYSILNALSILTIVDILPRTSVWNSSIPSLELRENVNFWYFLLYFIVYVVACDVTDPPIVLIDYKIFNI